MIEERVDRDLDGTDDHISQQVWGQRYIDDAVAKRITEDSVSRRYFYLTDAMFSVRALTNSTGFVQERVDYTPYGVALHRYAADVNDDGVLSFFDVSAMTGYANQSPGPVPGDGNYDPDSDLNGDGDINNFDVSAFMAIYNAQSSNTVPDGWITDPTDASWTDNTVGYDGYHFDYAGAADAGTGGVYCVRHRVYDPAMGSWWRRDPLGPVGGATLYEYTRSNPINLSDIYGLSPDFWHPHRPFHPNNYQPDKPDGYDEKMDNLRKQCSAWIQQQKANGIGWAGNLPNCPCDIFDENGCAAELGEPWGEVEESGDGPTTWEPYHPAGTYQLRSKPKKNGDPGQQCVYDAQGKLITGGRSAGTPDYVSPVVPRKLVTTIDQSTGQPRTILVPTIDYILGHRREDVDPFTACHLSGMLNEYHQYRPPNNGNNCPDNQLD